MASPWKDARGVIVSTTPTLEGRPIQEYCGIVTGEVIVGANLFRDLFANIRDIVGGRSPASASQPPDGRGACSTPDCSSRSAPRR